MITVSKPRMLPSKFEFNNVAKHWHGGQIIRLLIFCLLSSTINEASAANKEKVCAGTSVGFSSNRKDYEKWRSIYSNCIYVDGNVEINMFDTYSEDDVLSEYALKTNYTFEYDFSFLDDIREITGYLLIHGNINLKTLRFKNLSLIRGKSLLYNSTFSLYIENNVMLETLDLGNLREIQRGGIYVQNNPRLCHMNEVNWLDLLPNKLDNVIRIEDNADPLRCDKCTPTCCNGTSSECGCWFPNGCQKLNKVTCHSRCEGGRCFGPGPYDCCDSQCLGGCDGPSKNDCIACTKLRMKTTGECLETCPRVQIPDPITGELVYNPNGMYQFGITCVKSCPKTSFIYKEFCLNNCPKNTYEDEELVQNPATGEKGIRRFCKSCTPEKCVKTCKIDGELSVANIKNLEDCVVLKGNLVILNNQRVSDDYPVSLPRELNETDLQILSSLRVINGFVRIQTDSLRNLNFLQNLEIVRGNHLLMTKFSMLIISSNLKTLNLKKLKRIENGIVHLYTKELCLYETINWKAILGNDKSFVISNDNQNYTRSNQCAADGYVCDQACKGCWSTDAKSCQFCNTYKLDDSCVQTCNNTEINGKYTYVDNNERRECSYCHEQCKFGCTGPTEYDCIQCTNYQVSYNSLTNNSFTKCVDSCPKSHFTHKNQVDCVPCYKDCYGCSGPGNSISQGGCNQCFSALVRNDANYSVIKCIEKDSYYCADKEFSVVVPETLKTHPLRGKQVCRQCNDECDGCYMNGVQLNSQCKKCKNYFSQMSGNCVSNCSTESEYLVNDKKICMGCSSECKSGCWGSDQFECTECRTYKLTLGVAEQIIQLRAQDTDLREISFNDQTAADKLSFLNQLAAVITDTSPTSIKLTSTNEIVKSVKQFYLKLTQNLIDSNKPIVFCVSACPPEFQYKTSDNFCTEDAYPYSFGIAFGSLFLVIMIILVVFVLFIIIWQRRIKIKQMERENEEKFFSADFNKENDSFDGDSNKMNTSNLRLIKLNELELTRILGRGAFGTVYEGYYKPLNEGNYRVKVAIKVLNKCKLSDEKAVTRLSEELINEAKVMASVDHEYCLRLTALCLAEPMMMVTQLMQHGSVVSFYQKYRDLVTEKMLLTWSMQIAEGMCYLESRGIVHRDLAARNILVKKFDQIKITDFGLARILDSSQDGVYILEYSLVPFKWLAIESIKNRLFNHKSDVWSYGICLWEIFTFCSKPYAEYPDSDPLTIFNCICKGTRLAKPQMASLDVYTILLRCWLENPIARPDFKILTMEFSKMCMDPKRYLSIDKANNQPFRTIDDNTQDLLQEFKLDYFDAPDLSTRTKSESSDKSLSKEEYTDPETASSGFGDTSSSNIEKTKLDENIEKSLIIKTFKRPNNNLKIPITNTRISDEAKRQKFQSGGKVTNNKRIRKFFGGFGEKQKRLDSEISTGTNSTYLSYSCSSVSSPSPQAFKDEVKNLNFNFYEEQEELLNNTNVSYNFSSSPPSRSNSNSTHSSELGPCQGGYGSNRCSSIYKNQRSTTQNSDYLEPIMTNVMQNFEYFGNDNEKRTTPAIIIMPEIKSSNKKTTYYNEDMSSLMSKKHAKTTEI